MASKSCANQSVTSKRKASGAKKTTNDAMPTPLGPQASSAPSHCQTVGSNSIPVEGTTSTSPICKKTRSGVWEHYEKIKDPDGNETGRAKCVWCDRSYQCKSEQGTSGLWKHLRETCKNCPIKKDLVDAHKSKDKTQKMLSFQSGTDSEDGKLTSWHFDQEFVRAALVKMIIKDELPFRFVEGEGFKDFIEAGMPMFQIPSRYTIARDCFSLFVKEKKKLKAILQSQCQRVSLTTDTWTSIQNVNYLCLTAHFIDSDWNLQKRILNFCVIRSHKGVNIGNAIDFCMDEWGLKKVMCITVDNASSNDTAVQQLKKRLLKKDAFVLGGEAFHMRCFAHILQLIVRDGLEIAHKSIKKIRDVVRYVRGSPQRLDLFKKCCVDANIKSKAFLQLDCPTRWNSTYLMLETALGFQKAFDKLEDVDEKFLVEFGDDLPTENDWIYAAHFTKFLKRFYDVTCKLSGSLYSTSNMYFPEIIRILKDLETFESSDDPYLVEMGKQMRAKFDKYWGSINKMNVMLFIAVVLDPRYKMKYLWAKYKIYYGVKDANDLVDRVTNCLKGLIEEYRIRNEERGTGEMGNSLSQSQNLDIDTIMEVDEEVDEFFLEEENQQKLATKGELDRYLEEFSEKYVHDFDILGWWKVNSVRYPIVSSVARDVLAIQSSTVAAESAFSTGGRTLDRFRSSLTPTTAEVLICCHDWLRNSKKPIQIEELIEDLANLESDVSQDPQIKESILARTTVDC